MRFIGIDVASEKHAVAVVGEAEEVLSATVSITIPRSGMDAPAARPLFRISAMASARSARVVSFAFWRSSSAMRLSRGSGAVVVGPRFLAFAPGANSPRSRAWRHVVRCDE